MIQIQPCFSDRKQYASLAQQEGLFFEVLELSIGNRNEELNKQIENWYKASGRTTSLHGAFVDINPVSSNLKIREASRRECQASCQLAKRLGAKNIIFHGSCFPFLRGEYMNAWADMSAQYYTELAEKYDLNLYIENSFDLDTKPMQELMKRITHPNVKICLDIGHANLSRMQLDEWFQDLGQWIGYLHLSDNPGDFDKHCALGEGTIDLDMLFSQLSYLDDDLPVTLEVGGIEEIRKSLKVLKKYGYVI